MPLVILDIYPKHPSGEWLLCQEVRELEVARIDDSVVLLRDIAIVELRYVELTEVGDGLTFILVRTE